MRETANSPAKTIISDSPEKFLFCSSLAHDAWRGSDEQAAYEWWYFDAISDDGRDALVVIFMDNFIFSPRYNAACSESQKAKGKRQKAKIEDQRPKTEDRVPAVAFFYYRDGKLLYRAINEFSAEEFTARTDFPACRIGESEFRFEATPYGVRYIIEINADLRGDKKLVAALEWLVVEHDFAALNCATDDLTGKHFWNLASPRSDVTGKLEVFDLEDNQTELIQFRGTGYHDHNFDTRWLPATVSEWQWGRAHFADSTAVFYRFLEVGAKEPITKFFLIKENKLALTDATFAANNYRRHFFGLKYPQKLDFLTGQDVLLTVKQTNIIDGSFFYLRFLSEMQLETGDGKVQETIGITEYLSPQSLKLRCLDWLVNMRIGRNGKGAFLP